MGTESYGIESPCRYRVEVFFQVITTVVWLGVNLAVPVIGTIVEHQRKPWLAIEGKMSIGNGYKIRVNRDVWHDGNVVQQQRVAHQCRHIDISRS